MTPKFFYLETYGCTANQNNSEIISGILYQSGLQQTANPNIADFLVINTCIVKEPTEKKIEQRISCLQKYEKPLIIAGCMPEVRRYLSKMPNTFLLGTHQIKKIANLVSAIFNNKKSEKFRDFRNEEKLMLPKTQKSRCIGITQILEGCNGNCSFCLTKKAKGPLFSYSQSKILSNIKNDLSKGCKEIWLTSQDNAAYGLDKNEKSQLPELLNEITSIQKKFKIRIGMMNPNNILPVLDELIQAYKNEKIYKFLHIPVQSGSDFVLSSMNRKYTISQFLQIISKFKKQFPKISISTDVIAAFPGESDKDFQKTVSIIKTIKPDILNISKYWPMKGTSASTLNQIPLIIARKRSTELMNLHLSICLENNQKLINTTQHCFVYEKGFSNTFLARNNSYRLIAIRSEKNILGKFVKCKITEAKPHYLIAEAE